MSGKAILAHHGPSMDKNPQGHFEAGTEILDHQLLSHWECWRLGSGGFGLWFSDTIEAENGGQAPNLHG
jgi:hypothetical protein